MDFKKINRNGLVRTPFSCVWTLNHGYFRILRNFLVHLITIQNLVILRTLFRNDTILIIIINQRGWFRHFMIYLHLILLTSLKLIIVVWIVDPIIQKWCPERLKKVILKSFIIQIAEGRTTIRLFLLLKLFQIILQLIISKEVLPRSLKIFVIQFLALVLFQLTWLWIIYRRADNFVWR